MHTANLRTNILDFRGFDSSIIVILRGRIPRPIGDFTGKFESSNLGRDDVSREIGRTHSLTHSLTHWSGAEELIVMYNTSYFTQYVIICVIAVHVL